MSRRERYRDRDRDRGPARERDGRDSETKRRRSGFDRKLSHKRSRRDAKPETERVVKPSSSNLDGVDDNQKQRKRLQDALPLQPPPADSSAKESEKKSNGHDNDGSKHVPESDLTQIPRSRSYLQIFVSGVKQEIDCEEMLEISDVYGAWPVADNEWSFTSVEDFSVSSWSVVAEEGSNTASAAVVAGHVDAFKPLAQVSSKTVPKFPPVCSIPAGA